MALCHLSESNLPHQPTSIISNIHLVMLTQRPASTPAVKSFHRLTWTFCLRIPPQEAWLLLFQGLQTLSEQFNWEIFQAVVLSLLFPYLSEVSHKMQIRWQIKEFVSHGATSRASHQPVRPSVCPSVRPSACPFGSQSVSRGERPTF